MLEQRHIADNPDTKGRKTMIFVSTEPKYWTDRGWTPELVRERLAEIRSDRPRDWQSRWINASLYLKHRRLLRILTERTPNERD
jgi:hypothetical protein